MSKGNDGSSQNITTKVTNWIKDSITGLNITQKIHQDVRAVMGISNDPEGPVSDLEDRLVTCIDQIVRKGKSPAVLFEDEAVWEAFEAIVAHFPEEQTEINVHHSDGDDQVQQINLFQSLHQYALGARSDEGQVDDHKRVLAQGTGFFNRKRLQRQIADVKTKINERTQLFQKIIFAEADKVEKGTISRQFELAGNRVTLEQLVGHSRQPDHHGDGPPLDEGSIDDGPPLNEPMPPEPRTAQKENDDFFQRKTVRDPQIGATPHTEPSPQKPKSILSYLPASRNTSQTEPQRQKNVAQASKPGQPDIISWDDIKQHQGEEPEPSFELDF